MRIIYLYKPICFTFSISDILPCLTMYANLILMNAFHVFAKQNRLPIEKQIITPVG